ISGVAALTLYPRPCHTRGRRAKDTSCHRHEYDSSKENTLRNRRKNRREAPARGAKVGRLALIKPCRDELDFSRINVATQIDLEVDQFIADQNAPTARFDALLRDVRSRRHDFFPYAPRELVAAIRGPAAVAHRRLEEQATAVGPEIGGIHLVHLHRARHAR